ncbi:MAG: ABC transporter permease [Candidatus Methanoplasma sp.]|nr:ABC transporter permease [Candidatus Methanoplasma sp.]
MFELIKETYYVAWGDLRFMRHTAKGIIISSLAGPLLYLLAFGFGMGVGTYTDGVPYVAFIIPGIAAMTSLSASFGPTSTRLHVQRVYFRSLDEMMLCPLSTPAIVLGKSINGFIRGLVSSCIILLVGFMIVPEYLHLTPLYVISILLSCFTFSFLGVTAGLMVNSHQTMATFSSIVVLPMTFLCGTFFAVEGLHPAFQAVLYALPLTHSSEIVRASALGWDFPWISLVILFCLCALIFLLNVYLVKTKKV